MVPGWVATSPELRVGTVVALAQVKLLGGVAGAAAAEVARDIRLLARTALWANLISCAISPQHPDVNDLIGSLMATAVSVSSDRVTTAVFYPYEPALTEAARDLIVGDLAACVEAMGESMASSLIAGGNRGEIVAQMCLIMASLRSKDRMVSLGDFLGSRMGPTVA